MKKILFAMMAALVMFAGCKKSNITEAGAEGVGRLSLSIANEDNPEYLVKSSIDDADVNTFAVTITSTDGYNSYNQTWDTYSSMPQILELVSGTYNISVTSPKTAQVAFDQPVFGAAKDFAVQVGAVSNVELVCTIQNMMVTINASAEFLSELSEYQITVRNSYGSLTWDPTNISREGFFDVAPLEVTVRGVRHNGETAPEQYLKINDVAAKDHHIINLGAKVTGDAGFTITVDNTVVDREQNITVPGFEEIPVDSGDENTGSDDTGSGSDSGSTVTPSTAPTLVWAANPTFETMTISDPMEVALVVNAPEAIEDFIVKVESPTTTFLTLVAAMVSTNNAHVDEGYVLLDLIDDATATGSLLRDLLPVGNALYGKTSVDFPLSTLVPLIDQTASPEPGSIHTFTLMVTDKKGQQLSQPVKFQTAAE